MASCIVKRSPSVKDKVFLVTGGAAGVGAGVVRALLSENAGHVAFLDVAEREGAALEGELLNNFGALRAKFIKCDVSNEAQLAAAYKQVVDKYHRLDCVINNAAIISADERDYEKMVDINFKATVSSTIKAIDAMGADKGGSGGTVINMSSLLAFNPTNHLPIYAATKTAVFQFSVAMGSEQYYQMTKVRVVTICLGPTDTAILHRGNSENFNKDSTMRLTSRVPVRQRVESASTGIIDVINQATSGSTWIIENDKPAYDYSENIAEAFKIISKP